MAGYILVIPWLHTGCFDDGVHVRRCVSNHRSWFDKPTTNVKKPFALSLSKGDYPGLDYPGLKHFPARF